MNEFEKLYLAYFNDVYKFVLSMSKNNAVAEEIVQETFFKALKNINSLSNECSVKSWLFQIAKNTYFTYISKNNKNIALDSINDIATNVDIEKKLDTLLKEKEKIINSIERRTKLLANQNYVSKAPKELVENEKKTLEKEKNALKT